LGRCDEVLQSSIPFTLTETLLHITRDILKTTEGGNILKIDKGLLLDIRDLLAFAYKKMKHKNLLDLLEFLILPAKAADT